SARRHRESRGGSKAGSRARSLARRSLTGDRSLLPPRLLMSRHRRQRFALAASKDDRSIRLAAGEPLASSARPEDLDALVTACSSEPEMRDRLVGGRVAVGTKEGSSSHLAFRFDGDDRAEGLERTLERLHLQPAAALGRRVVSEDANS